MDTDLPSPSFVVDLDRVRANTQRMAAVAREQGLSLRPHVKTHKTVQGAALQCAGFAPKIVASTLQECEFLASRGGQDDIVYGVLLEPSKFARAWALHDKIAALHVLIDAADTLAALSAFADTVPPAKKLSIFLAVDATNYRREGVSGQAIADTVALATAIAQNRAFSLAGIYSHCGNSYNRGPESWHAARAAAARVGAEERDTMLAVAAAIRAAGIPLPTVSIGATPAMSSGMTWPRDQGIELHPGNYIFYDRQQVESGSCQLADVACYVVARVLARYPDRNEFLIDAGGCAMHKDPAGLSDGTWGCLLSDPSLVLKRMTQEVAVVGRLDESPIDWSEFPPGRVVRVLPNHSCMTAACHEVYHVVAGELETGQDGVAGRKVLETWTPAKFWQNSN